MTTPNQAQSRFGLGPRADSPLPADPQRWLLEQFTRFDPRPAALSALADTPALLEDLAEALELRKANRQAKRAVPPAAGSQDQVQVPASPASGDLAPEVKAARERVRDHYIAAVGARTNIALGSDTPFLEAMVHFWANHFAVSIDKLQVTPLAGPLEFEAIRPQVLGRFADMLLAVERHPAMLLYLDQAQSVGPDSVAGTIAARRGARKVGLNENLAREVLELHTLGVRSGYSQADVTELARALTGWTVAGLKPSKALPANAPPGMVFAPLIHQPGARQVLGRRYDQPGEAQARAVLADLAAHPATARHLATKLARHFAADDPPPALVARLEAAWLDSHGDLPTIYRVLVESPECWAGAKFRSPWEWGIAALRAVNQPSLPPKLAAGFFTQLGQQVWKPGSPAGYDDTAAAWAAPDALLRRVEAAARIAHKAAPTDARALAERLYGPALSTSTRAALAGAETPQQALALLLVAPEMLRR